MDGLLLDFETFSMVLLASADDDVRCGLIASFGTRLATFGAGLDV